MTTFVVPESNEITTLLGMLYGEGLAANDCEVDSITSYQVATFVDDEGKVVATCSCDIPFVVYSGAALSMIPSGGADDMIAENDVSDAVVDNFHEVMNICSKLLMNDSGAHLRLGELMLSTQAADSIGVQALESEAKKSGFEIDFPGYGKGKMLTVIS